MTMTLPEQREGPPTVSDRREPESLSCQGCNVVGMQWDTSQDHTISHRKEAIWNHVQSQTDHEFIRRNIPLRQIEETPHDPVVKE